MTQQICFMEKSKFLEWLASDNSHVHALFLAGTVHGPKLQAFAVPYEFMHFTTTRDKTLKVTSITDGISTIDGGELASLTLLENIRARGYDVGFFQLKSPSWMLGLKQVMTDKYDFVVDKKEEKTIEATRIYTFDAQTANFAPPDTILKILSYDYVKVEDFKTIAVAISNAAKEGNDIDELDLSDATKLSSQLQASDAAVATQALSQTLYASYLKELTLDEKIQAFISNPSLRVATLIDLKQPTKLKLVHTSNKSDVQTVALGKLKPEDDIILSNVAISQDFYQEVAVASEVMVVKYVKGLGVKNAKQKVAPLKEPDLMKAKDFLAICEAIEKDNKAKGTTALATASAVKVDAESLASFFQS